MMRCSFCGHENQSDSGSCEKCKADMSIPVAAAVAANGSDIPFVDTLLFDKFPLVQPLANGRIASAELTQPFVLSKAPPEAAAPLTVVAVDETKTDAPSGGPLPEETKPRLVVKRGEKLNMQYPIYPGKNYIGRTDEKPVDIDLENQEPIDRIWTSRQHAVITFEDGVLTIEDLNSLNGTFVNRTRVHPGQSRTLQINDIIQVGTVQMRVIAG